MRRWEVAIDGAKAGHVYADTAEAARRAARAAAKRIFPDREQEPLVRLDGEGEPVASEPVEARRLASEVYEGLRLLPGMELPAEKLRNVLLLLESAVARAGGEGLEDAGALRGGGGGDTELLEALEPVLKAELVPSLVKERLRGLVEWVGARTGEAERRQVELKLLGALHEAGLVDEQWSDTAPCALYRASAFLVARLRRAGALRVERFEGATSAEQFRAALAPWGKDGAELTWAFLRAHDGAEAVELRRPLVVVGERLLQPARLARGVDADPEVVAFDRALFDSLDRLRAWSQGLGRLAEPHLSEPQRQLIPRTEKRIDQARQQMAKAAKEGGEVLPLDTARRDLIKLVIDQVHRLEDALALLPDRSLREAFGELVFKDVVYRGAGDYLCQRFGITVDMEVVPGAEAEGLTGRYKKEPGPAPRSKTTRIHSVVIPCYVQAGVAIRPASVRLGTY